MIKHEGRSESDRAPRGDSSVRAIVVLPVVVLVVLVVLAGGGFCGQPAQAHGPVERRQGHGGIGKGGGAGAECRNPLRALRRAAVCQGWPPGTDDDRPIHLRNRCIPIGMHFFIV